MAGSTPSPALLPASASQSCSKETKTGPTIWNSHQLVKLYPETPNADVDSEPFIVHRDFATCYSPVLKAAFESGFIEGQKQEYRFDEDFDEDVIRILSQWFYTQKIDLGNIREPDLGPPISTIDLRIDCLIKLWVLADRLLIPKLQNVAIESLKVISNEASVLPADLNTAKGSPLRIWFIYQFAFEYDVGNYLEQAQRFPHGTLEGHVPDFLLTKKLRAQTAQEAF
ncbi:uncharacterized protein PAC_01022 [Phialocephala subalpina]|uniref:BTB domain-containing protein n=1 Tax=Phialocephala subalpina TaxID=576137 RepID=A0A1L7WEE4_9HELO|nr:uncharacterized protein PAC_01022 [Phialocephala subalpina]